MTIVTTALALRAFGALSSLDADTRRALEDRSSTTDPGVRERTRAIIDDVRTRGDDALREMARRFDGVSPDVSLERLDVPRAAWDAALAALDPSLRASLERAARNIASVHAAFRPTETITSPEPGITVGRRPDPLERVGIYAPGGRAAYPSSLLMGAIPARVAGVREVIVCTPPGADGQPSPVVLAAAALAQVDRVFVLGGAGAVAAMAYGTASVPRVDRIMGPGNAYVAEAKLQVVNQVAIDAPAGPSELLVLADSSADVEAIAREMLAQAEHDPDAAVLAVLFGDGGAVASQAAGLRDALERQVATTPRGEVVRASLAARGGVVWCTTRDEAVNFANAWAAEHLLLVVRDALRQSTLDLLRAAGTIFVGASSSVAYGDYMTGANHVLPTAGAGRSYSGLSTLDFVRWTTWQEVTPAAAASLADDVGRFADAEGLPAHAAAARAWAGASGNTSISAQSEEPRDRLAFARALYDAVPLYDPKRAPVALDLTDNTNLWGLPPSAERTLREAPVSRITRYPSLYAADLKAELAAYVGSTPERLVTGCGSDDILDSAMRAFGEPGSVVAASEPSFAMIPIFAQMNGLRYVGVTERADHQPDIDALLAAKPRILYLCSPNNPTGAVTARATIERAVREAPGVVFLDEAYAEFAGVSAVDLANTVDNLLVIRTMSKAFGLAGLRIGYAIGAPALVRDVEKSRGPYKLSALAEQAALSALRDDRLWIDEHVALAVRNRERLIEALRARGYAPLTSHANYVCVPVADSVAFGQALRERGVAARPFPGLPHVGDTLRISVGPWEQVEQFLAAFDAVRQDAVRLGAIPQGAAQENRA
ncbi:histidinol dehydrogenase [Gemmatimonas sp. UBA7669]|uniref:histidinol dehydrogenase n=1 Tax=Gemmatimonas sp. UBA7669 TaxID=1946568 RepID=UPI0025C09C57|nr:histidinol dehydrogenase [Gemmatimonas sp. UBA7669]